MTERAHIELRIGDIFESGADVLVNPVNTVGVMGKGLALAFKQRYPEMFEHYVKRCEKGFWPGDIYEWPTGQLFGSKIVLNFATKGHWRDASNIEDIRRGLEKLDDWLERNTDIESIAIPALGCGLGGLEWGRVKARILYQFEDFPRPVHIMVYEPQ